jgi:hypothetical protein
MSSRSVEWVDMNAAVIVLLLVAGSVRGHHPARQPAIEFRAGLIRAGTSLLPSPEPRRSRQPRGTRSGTSLLPSPRPRRSRQPRGTRAGRASAPLAGQRRSAGEVCWPGLRLCFEWWRRDVVVAGTCSGPAGLSGTRARTSCSPSRGRDVAPGDVCWPGLRLCFGWWRKDVVAAWTCSGPAAPRGTRARPSRLPRQARDAAAGQRGADRRPLRAARSSGRPRPSPGRSTRAPG